MFVGYKALAAASVAFFLIAIGQARAADTYNIDPVHSSVSFQADHAGVSRVHGRFNKVSGSITIDKEDPSKSSFELNFSMPAPLPPIFGLSTTGNPTASAASNACAG